MKINSVINALNYMVEALFWTNQYYTRLNINYFKQFYTYVLLPDLTIPYIPWLSYEISNKTIINCDNKVIIASYGYDTTNKMVYRDDISVLDNDVYFIDVHCAHNDLKQSIIDSAIIFSEILINDNNETSLTAIIAELKNEDIIVNANDIYGSFYDSILCLYESTKSENIRMY